jgi:galactoside O-acetyltransferase
MSTESTLLRPEYHSEESLRSFGFGRLGSNVKIKKSVQVTNPGNLFIENNVIISDGALLSTSGPLILGNNVHISAYCIIYSGYGVEFEDYSGISSRVAIYSESDDYSGCSLTNPTIPRSFKPAYKAGKVLLKKHSIVGCGSTILPGVTIGEGAAVGAHSLVTKSLSPWVVYFGSPAKKIHKRSRELMRVQEIYECSVGRRAAD